MNMLSPRSIASVGSDLPFALLKATGRYAGPLLWNIDRDMPKAAQWLESKFPLWAFSLVEDWATGAFDHLETVVFSRGDDAAQRLYYYLCELRDRNLVGGPEPLIFDVAHIARPSSEARTIEAVRRLAERFGVNEAELEVAITHEKCADLQQSQGQGQGQGQRNCLLLGTPPPDHRVHKMIQASGWAAHGFTLADLWAGTSAQAPCRNTSDVFAALGNAVHGKGHGPRSFANRQAFLRDSLSECKADCAILWFTEEDEAEVWNLPAQQNLLAELNVATLVLTRASWRADDGVAEKIESFLTNLEVV